MKQYLSRGLVILTCAASLAVTARANDALLNKLVAKGILTKEEADELKKESEASFDKAHRAKTGLPDFVTSLRLYGDVRGRFEGFYFDNDTDGAPNEDRNRMRYRLRVGALASFKQNLELGFRFISSEPQGSLGGDPISGNSTFQDNGSKKFIWIDQAFGRWSPVINENWKMSGTIGKMENPFALSPLVFDDDYTPEGVAITSSHKLNAEHALRLAGGFFWLDEINQGEDANNDPFLLGAQARWDAVWSPRWESSLSAALLAITDERTLTNFAVPNSNAGNTRRADGTLATDYIPAVAEASITYYLDSFAGYKARFPLRFGGTFLHNTGASTDNMGYELGITAGKAGKKNTWEASYRWRYMERDAWYEEAVDSDFGAFYEVAQPTLGAGFGYRAGPNTRGHIFRAAYSPADAFTFGVTYILAELIDAPEVGGSETESLTSRVQVDAVWRF